MSNRYHDAQKVEQLGMTGGKARNILCKTILFSFIQQLHKDFCYRCGSQITSIDSLTIDHKKPWLNEPNAAELFFDLQNISFAHASCNVQAKRLPTHFRGKSIRVVVNGKLTCTKCKKEKETQHFHKCSSHKSGYTYYCKQCKSALDSKEHAHIV